MKPLLCVVHIPKTAGTSIRGALTRLLGEDKVYWIGHKRPLSHWNEADGSEFDDFLVVGGHAATPAFEKIRRPKIYMAVVRDPVHRTISLFNYITKGPDGRHPLREKLEGLSLVQALEVSPQLRADVSNRQCFMIGGEPKFSSALRSICVQNWFIDRHEAADQLLARVCKRFNWPATPLFRENVGREGYVSEYLNEDAVSAIDELTTEDRRLYDLFG